jgi:lipopolysaccharide/colanic/teichoic acid biosynthesis glycosyltransferase
MSPLTLTTANRTNTKPPHSSRTVVPLPRPATPAVVVPAAPMPSASTRLPDPTLPEVSDASPVKELVIPAFVAEEIHASATSFWKRVIDLVGGVIGLGFTALLFIPIAVAIQLDNPGPVLYSQERCSVGGKRFRIWKFRSMETDADAKKQTLQNEASGHIFKMENDPRITKVGKFLRRTSLDEFPQFWNVLMGDMSLVGTRPPSLDEVANYAPNHWRRLLVKPGITGVWQVNGRSTVKDFEAIVKLDLSYQDDWSVRYDLYLIFKTIWVVFNKDGAC